MMFDHLAEVKEIKSRAAGWNVGGGGTGGDPLGFDVSQAPVQTKYCTAGFGPFLAQLGAAPASGIVNRRDGIGGRS